MVPIWKRPCAPNDASRDIFGVNVRQVGRQNEVKTGSIMIEPVCGPRWDRFGRVRGAQRMQSGLL